MWTPWGEARVAGFILSSRPFWYNAEKVQSGLEGSMARLKKKNLGMALGRVASLGLAFSALRLPTSPSLHLSKASGGSRVEASHSAFVPPQPFPPLHPAHVPFWGRGMRGWDAWPAGNH